MLQTDVIVALIKIESSTTGIKLFIFVRIIFLYFFIKYWDTELVIAVQQNFKHLKYFNNFIL